MSRWIAAVVAMVSLAGATPAGATPALADDEVRISITAVRGPKAKQVRRALVEVLQSLEGVVLSARARNADLQLKVEVQRQRRDLIVELVIADQTGETVSRKRHRGRSPTAALWLAGKDLRRQARAVLAARHANPGADEMAAAPTPAAAPAAVGAAADDAADVAAASATVAEEDLGDDLAGKDAALLARGGPRRQGTARIEVAVGLRLWRRTLRYNQDLLTNLSEHRAPARPSAVVTASWRPFARGPLVHAGVRGQATYALPFSTRDEAGNAYPTTAREYLAGVFWGRALGPMVAEGELSYGAHEFSLAGSDTMTTAPIPDVAYRYVRVGAAASTGWGRLGGRAAVGYRHVLSSGEISSASYFPRAQVAGLDASLELKLQVTRAVTGYFATSVERYFYGMNPEPGDPYVVGGAIDQAVAGELGVAMSF